MPCLRATRNRDVDRCCPAPVGCYHAHKWADSGSCAAVYASDYRRAHRCATGVSSVSCAGGVVATYTCPIVREHKTGSTLTLDISGLLGGHSGSDINLERGNGNLIMARIIGVPRAFARAASRYRYGIMRHFSCVKKRTTSQDSSS